MAPLDLLTPCSAIRSDSKRLDLAKKTAIGSLATSSLRDIWHGQALRNFRLAHLRRQRHTIEACKNCTFLYTAPDDLDHLSAETYLQRSRSTSPLKNL